MKSTTQQKQIFTKALLFYPPVGYFQRGESRCQANIEESAAISLRACNDLGYLASALKEKDIECLIKDYPGEKKDWNDFEKDLKIFNPDIIITSITTASILQDMKAFDIAKTLNPNIITIAQGAFFFTCDPEDMPLSQYKDLDIAIFGEPETIIVNLLETLNNKTDLSSVDGLLFQHEGVFKKTNIPAFIEDLDTFPFPDRSKMNNNVYIRPDTGKPQATIQVSRGCPQQCTYCLTPIISGSRYRRRSVGNVIAEITECVEKFKITDFFFRADTFNIDRNWVLKFCHMIKEANLKINWVANSRVTPLDDQMLLAMKDAGCWLIALGIESGSQKTLDRIKKNITIEQVNNAVSLIKKHKISIYGFFMIGFYWETKADIEKTIDFALKSGCDFYEIHIATPYKKTPLYLDMKEKSLIDETCLTGFDYFSGAAADSKYLSKEEIEDCRKKALRKIYLRPRFILKKLLKTRNLNEIKAYFRYGLLLLKNISKKNHK